MLSEKLVDLAIRRLGRPKDVLIDIYDNAFTPPEIKGTILAYANGELNIHLTKYNLNRVKDMILNNNGHNGRELEEDKDFLKVH